LCGPGVAPHGKENAHQAPRGPANGTRRNKPVSSGRFLKAVKHLGIFHQPMLIEHPPSHYLKMMYLESTCYHPPAARCAIDTVGVDHFIFGTDSPPLFVLKEEGVDLINRLGLTDDEKDKVYYRNAKQLLKL
jgi:predicted TIM-barrel fold metal-dependent hydrolase